VKDRPVTGRVRLSTTLLLASVLAFAGAALVQLGRGPDDLVGWPALVLLGAGAGSLVAGLVTLVSAFRARRRLRERLGLGSGSR
jgi:hypothetical protein